MASGILDVLSSDISVVGSADFTANGAVADVLVNNPAGNGMIMYNGAGQSKFALGDNLLIQKIWATVPWGFGQGGAGASPLSHVVSFDFFDGVSLYDIGPIPNDIAIPTLCDPLDFGDGLYAPMAIVGALRQIRLTHIVLRISQINIPAILDGTRIPVQYFMQVRHTLGMSV